MKISKFIGCALAASLALVACEKHEILFEGSEPVGNKAMFHICYFAPVAANTTNALDSVYVNGKFLCGIGGAGQLSVYNLQPTSGTRYFSVPAGETKITIYKKDAVVYEKTVSLKSGKQDVYVPALSMDPIIVDVPEFPTQYQTPISDPTKFETDSVCSVRVINLLWEPDGNGGVAPTARKLQYQWRDNTGAKDANGQYYWNNIGEPVGFGEYTERSIVRVNKSVKNSSGYVRINYRMVDANTGDQLLTDYWTEYIGRGYDHIYRGVYGTVPSGYLKNAYTQFIML